MAEVKEKSESTQTSENGCVTALCDAAKESAGLGIAEGASMGVSWLTYAAAEKVAPGLVARGGALIGKGIEKTLGVEFIEKWIGKASDLSLFKPDTSLPISARSAGLGKGIIKFGAAITAAIATKMAVRKIWNSFVEVNHEPEPKTGNWFKDNILYRWFNKHDLKVLFWDEAVHFLALVAMNKVIPNTTQKVVDKVARFMERNKKYSLGLVSDAANANGNAFYGIVWEIPNALGWMAGTAAILHSNLTKDSPTSHVDRLKQENKPSKNITVPSENIKKTEVEKLADRSTSDAEYSISH